MILYSIVPAETVFLGNNYLQAVNYLEADYRGEKVIVARLSDNHYEISKLLSTNPNSFLNPSLQPGSVIDTTMLKMRNNPS